MPGVAAHANRSQTPYRGIRCQNQCYLRYPANCRGLRLRPENGPPRRSRDARCALLSVVLQHQIAGLRYLGTILLQAGQNGEIALIDHRAAVALNVARTSRLFLRRAAALLLGESTGGDG